MMLAMVIAGVVMAAVAAVADAVFEAEACRTIDVAKNKEQ